MNDKTDKKFLKIMEKKIKSIPVSGRQEYSEDDLLSSNYTVGLFCLQQAQGLVELAKDYYDFITQATSVKTRRERIRCLRQMPYTLIHDIRIADKIIRNGFELGFDVVS